MEKATDPIFPYVALVVQNLWAAIAIVLLVTALRNRNGLVALLSRITHFEVANIKVELQAVTQQIELAQAQIEELNKRNSELLTSLASEIDLNGPVEGLQAQRQALRATAASLDDADFGAIMQGLTTGAKPEELFAAAVVLKSRRDVAYFDELVACLGRLAKSTNLEGNRLNTVWTLTSVLHRMLVDQFQNRDQPMLSVEQLLEARQMLILLAANPRVRTDRPDAPSKGILGPLRHAQTWIERGLRQLHGQ